MPHLRLSPPEGPEEVLPLPPERLLIGRSRECGLVLPDVLLSRRHAEIGRTASGWVVRDLGSMNGTRLNGQRIEGERPLRDGDVVTVAGWRLAFHESEAPKETSSAPDHRARVQDIASLATRSGLELGDLTRQSRLLGTLTRAAGALVAAATVEEVMDTLLAHVLDAVPAGRGAVALVEGDPGVASVVAARARAEQAPMAIDPGLTERVLGSRTSIIAPRVPADDGTVRPVLCAPLWFTGLTEGSDRVVGLVALEATSEANPFEAEHLGLVSAVVNLASSRLESLRLRAESADKRRLEEDLRGAARIQASLLPEEIPALWGWDLAASSRLCSAVGADYYDFALERGTLLFALGDVAGKGLAAALCMAALRAAVRALWADDDPLPRLVSRMNDNLSQTLPTNRFATLFLARLDPATGEFGYVNAGHAAPLLVRREGPSLRLEEGGTILGALASVEWSEGRASLAPGDVLVLLSDGVMQAAGSALAHQTVEEVVCRERDGGGPAILSALQDAADAALGRESSDDDHTFVVLMRTPVAGP